MKPEPEVSEFSYGFAITNELISWYGSHMKTAPLFPSLVAEGKLGYDLKLDFGIPIYLQFKLSDYMERKNAKEFQQGLPYLPYYRMYLRPNYYSNQHNLLYQLEKEGNAVYYVAPAFYTHYDFNYYYQDQSIAKNSVFIRPIDIGKIDDDDEHRVCFESSDSKFFVYSEPRQIGQSLNFDKFTTEVYRQLERRSQTRLIDNLQRSVSSMINIIRDNYPRSFDDEIQENYPLLLREEYFRLIAERDLDISDLLQQIDSLVKVFFGCQMLLVKPTST